MGSQEYATIFIDESGTHGLIKNLSGNKESDFFLISGLLIDNEDETDFLNKINPIF